MICINDLMEVGDSVPTEGVTILVVSDDLYNVFTLTRRLESRRYSVLSASSEDAAIHLAREASPDVILLDVTRSQVNGLGLKETLNDLPETAEIPVMILANRKRADFAVQALALGAESLLAKPFHLEELFARTSVIVRRQLRQRRLVAEVERLASRADTGGVAVEDEKAMRSRLDTSMQKANQRHEPITCLHMKVTGLYELNNPPLMRQILMETGHILHEFVNAETDSVTALPSSGEFVLLSIGLSMDRAMVLAEGLRSTVAMRALPDGDAAECVELAIGIAGRPSGSDIRADDVLQGAKEAVQSAVEAGGGRTVVRRLAD